MNPGGTGLQWGREAGEVEGRALFPAQGPQAPKGAVYLERMESELVDF